MFIAESVQLDGEHLIAYFMKDKKKQRFKIHCTFNAFKAGIKIWDSWELNLKFRAKVLENIETKEKTYITYIECNEAKVIERLQDTHKSGK